MKAKIPQWMAACGWCGCTLVGYGRTQKHAAAVCEECEADRREGVFDSTETLQNAIADAVKKGNSEREARLWEVLRHSREADAEP